LSDKINTKNEIREIKIIFFNGDNLYLSSKYPTKKTKILPIKTRLKSLSIKFPNKLIIRKTNSDKAIEKAAVFGVGFL
tara:strand:+ start:132 stop:365 length:234 start_codon:yes stop_codon:yes gene_type:complete